MDPLSAFLSGIVGYLVGSISFARLVTRIADPHKSISHTEIKAADGKDSMAMEAINATAVSMHLGPRYGFLTVVLDMLKIAIPTLVVRYLFPEEHYFLIISATGMIGHIWPIYHRFKGGRGLSSVYGGLFAIDWIGVFVTSVGGMLFGLLIARDVFVAYMAGLWFLVPWLWFRTRDLGHVIYALIVNVIFVVAMIPEIRQMRRLTREGKQLDVSKAMQLTAMGRGIYKMAKKLGVVKDEQDAQ
jgi:glycerol-3-phosphate acyltransferase PlsY